MQELKNGDVLMLDSVSGEMTAQVARGRRIRFMLEEQGTPWTVDYNPGECALTLEHRQGDGVVSGRAAVEVESKVQTPVRLEFVCGERMVRVLVYTVAAQVVSPLYPASPVLSLLKKACFNRGIVPTDWHLHIRGGMTPELAAQREEACFIRSSAMENHGREWEIYDNARLKAFAENARRVQVGGHRLPVGIQVNDRDWFKQIDAETRSCFDYFLADTMIMGKLPSGRDNRLWLDQTIGDALAWMERYMAHNLQILGEPITILANPTYLPKEVAGGYDELWTEKRMKELVGIAVERHIALEIQAGSPFPRPRFLKLAKEMGATFSFGTNNFDPTPKDLSRWLEAIEWLDLKGDDILQQEVISKLARQWQSMAPKGE